MWKNSTSEYDDPAIGRMTETWSPTRLLASWKSRSNDRRWTRRGCEGLARKTRAVLETCALASTLDVNKMCKSPRQQVSIDGRVKFEWQSVMEKRFVYTAHWLDERRFIIVHCLDSCRGTCWWEATTGNSRSLGDVPILFGPYFVLPWKRERAWDRRAEGTCSKTDGKRHGICCRPENKVHADRRTTFFGMWFLQARESHRQHNRASTNNGKIGTLKGSRRTEVFGRKFVRKMCLISTRR